jgi:hypothetical protein
VTVDDRPRAEASEPHPSAERLAEYADGVLDEAARQEIERHLVDCPDCRAVLSETMAFAHAEGDAAAGGVTPARVVPFRTRRWVVGAASGLAAAAALVLVIRIARPAVFDGWFGPRSDRPELQELVAALANEPTRPVEGRLTGGFKYTPPPSPTRGPGDREVSPDVRIAAATIEKRAGERPSAEDEAALGIAFLALGNTDRAVALLEAATRRQPSRADFLSDLAAAYLARGSVRNDSADFRRSLDAANASLRINPGLGEAVFNRALALDALGRVAEARGDWLRYVDRESDPDWKNEARTHIPASSTGPR